MQNILDTLENIMYTMINEKEKERLQNLKNKKMKIARLEKDMNQEDLAKAVGVTRQTIGMIESGNYNPTLKLCVAICDALDKTLNDLFWTEKEERKDDK